MATMAPEALRRPFHDYRRCRPFVGRPQPDVALDRPIVRRRSGLIVAAGLALEEDTATIRRSAHVPASRLLAQRVSTAAGEADKTKAMPARPRAGGGRCE